MTVKGVKSVCPFGFRIETFDDMIVTFVNCRLTRWFSAPVNVPVDVLPDVEIVVVTDAPPGVIVKVAAPAAGAKRHAATAARAAAKPQRVEDKRRT